MPWNNKCEWQELKYFVTEFNKVNGTHYTLSECLDVSNRDSKQPEVLLECTNLPPVVIERKSVVWPPDFFSDHSNFHLLGEILHSKLSAIFDDGPYQLQLNESAFRAMKKKQIINFTDNIIKNILSQETVVKTEGVIRYRTPFPWVFRRLNINEIDEDTPSKGIGVLSISSSGSLDDIEIFQQSLNEARSGFSDAFLKAAQNANQKFCEYSVARKLFLVQFHGDSQVILDEDLLKIIENTELPEQIDEVWYATHNWINEYDFDIFWKRAV